MKLRNWNGSRVDQEERERMVAEVKESLDSGEPWCLQMTGDTFVYGRNYPPGEGGQEILVMTIDQSWAEWHEEFPE